MSSPSATRPGASIGLAAVTFAALVLFADLARADALPGWGLSLRAGPSVSKVEGDHRQSVRLDTRLAVWRQYSERSSLGLDLERLGIDAPAFGSSSPNEAWYRAGASWRRTSSPGSLQGFTSLGVGLYYERHPSTDSRNLLFIPGPSDDAGNLSVGPAAGVGLRLGKGSLKGALETRGHWALGRAAWIQLQAGFDFD
jgi:hypothetical protein